jgi:hypothetical protein
MKPTDLEIVYEHLAKVLDGTRADKRELLLAKLALLLANDLGDAARVRDHITAASANLDV